MFADRFRQLRPHEIGHSFARRDKDIFAVTNRRNPRNRILQHRRRTRHRVKLFGTVFVAGAQASPIPPARITNFKS